MKTKKCKCENCGYNVTISQKTVHEKIFPGPMQCRPTGYLIATYVECPVCGECILKQLDTYDTIKLAEKGVKLEIATKNKRAKKLSTEKKDKLKNITKVLCTKRQQLRKLYWNEASYRINDLLE